MAINLTEEQLSAVSERNKTLLVSAAAGSGKTATLTERIIRTLTDEDHPGEISRMLVVTFTRASAADLKNKISRALGEALATGRGLRGHLSRQLLLLPGAQISTIDSFCMNLVREYAPRIGLSPAFRMADNAEVRLLNESVMRTLIEDAYEGLPSLGTREEFEALVDCLTGTRGDKSLSDILLRLAATTQGFARSYRCLADMAEELREATGKAPAATPWGAYIVETTIDLADSYIDRYESHCAALAADEIAAAKYLPAMEEDFLQLRALRRAAAGGDYTALRDLLYGFQKAKLGTIPAAKKSEQAAAAQLMRQDFFDTLAKHRDRFFAYTAEEWTPMLAALADKVALLSRFMIAFGERIEAEKRRRSLCDFNDISHGALRLLYDERGEKTPLAAELASRFDYVYVDEYQDVNEVQHLLFEALSGPRGRFMVGDVKQSIYGFRGAQPEIFARTRRAFPRLQEAGESESATLTLSANFRSDKPILDFVNMIFGGLMQGVGEHIGYDTGTDSLHPGREKAPASPRVTVALFPKEAGAGEAAEEEPAEDEEWAETTPEEEKPDAEALYVAEEIRRLLKDGLPDGQRLAEGDIAILVRKASVGERFANALTACGVRVDRPRGKGFFLNPEILLAVSLLNVIDNPRRDIYLAGLLYSPLYSFTPDELTALRQEADACGRTGSTLYEALVDYMAAHPDFEKGRYFLAELAAFRRMAEGMPVDRLIRQLYRRTGLLSLAGADKSGSPDARRANLMLLYDYARRFEASSFRGLYNFIAYINEVIERDESIEEGRLQSGRADTVRIMTMHQSKGLEFPVCFVVGCGSCFNLQDTQAPLLFEREMGCALKLRDASGFARIKNPVYNTISARIREKQLEEEMRVLYVAMTRPYSKLYLTGSLRGEPEQWLEKGRERARLGKQEVYACRSYAEMVLATLRDEPFCELLFPAAAAGTQAAGAADAAVATPVFAEDEVGEVEALLSARFAYPYPDRYLGDLPSKLSVSRLYPGVLDEGDEQVPDLVQPRGEQEAGADVPEEGRDACKAAPLPRFMGGAQKDAAARAGTATHLFMQFCDLFRLAERGAEAELARLTEQQFITEEDAALVRLEEIKAFCRSSLFAAMTESGAQLYREQRFHVRLPADVLTKNEARREALAGETVLVQGVMDAVLCRPNGELWLIDYKTDRLLPAERRDRRLAEERLQARHGNQLAYYAEACCHMLGRRPDRVLIYSLALGDTVELAPTLPPTLP